MSTAFCHNMGYKNINIYLGTNQYVRFKYTANSSRGYVEIFCHAKCYQILENHNILNILHGKKFLRNLCKVQQNQVGDLALSLLLLIEKMVKCLSCCA